MAPLPHDSVSRLEAGQLDQSKGSTEKATLGYSSDGLHSTTRTSQDRAPTERMPSAGRLIAMLLLSFLVTFGVASAISPKSWHRQPCPGEGSAVLLQEAKIEANGEDQVSFKSLLESASPNSLHELLHKYFPDRFKHGVWESDVSAVEALRRANEVLAVNIVQLAKRQDNGTTSSPEPTTTPPTTTNPPTTTDTPTEEPTAPSTTAPSTTPPAPSSTEEPGTTAPSTTAPGTTAPPPVTTSQSPSPTEPSTSDVPSSPSTSPSTTTRPTTSPPGTSSSSDITESEPSSSLSTSAPSFTSSKPGTSPTGFANTSRPGLSSTSRPQGASTLITDRPTGRPSLTPSVKPVTSTFTSTNPDGGVVIVTATTYVPADPQQTEAQTSTRATPGLQNAAPGRQGKQVAGVGAGIVLGAMLLI